MSKGLITVLVIVGMTASKILRTWQAIVRCLPDEQERGIATNSNKSKNQP